MIGTNRKSAIKNLKSPVTSPLAVRRTLARDVRGCTMHIGDALSAFRRVGIVASGNSPIFLTRDGIDRKFAHISRRNEFIERLWQLPFVGAVLIEKRSHFVQIVSQDGLTRVHDCFLVL